MIEELRKKIAENKKEIEEQELALAVIERMFPASVFPHAPHVVEEQRTPYGVPNTASHEAVPDEDTSRHGVAYVAPPKLSQKESVKLAIDKLSGNEFTVSVIDDVLKQESMQFEGKNPKNRISVVLGSLEADGVIRKVVTGGGNVPHRYKKK
jgi:hypothetical protein